MMTRRNVLRLAGATGFITATGNFSQRKIKTGALQAALDDITAGSAVGALARVRGTEATSGVTMLGSDQAVHPDSRFRAGSITKPFIATVVLQLVGEGRLALDDVVRNRLPGLLPDGITVRHLLQHTSGLPNYTNSPAFGAVFSGPADLVRLRYRTWTPRELLGFVDGMPLRFEPGTDWWYANTNYVLLGLLIERVTGSAYATEIRRRILRPLGLRGTELPGTDPHLRGPHPHGYVPAPAPAPGPVDITVFNPSLAGAAGEIISTTADLNTFFRALVTGRLLRPAEQRELLTFRRGTPDYDYGLGLMTKLLPSGVRVWGHSGDFLDAYWTESWTTGDRSLTVATTPWSGPHPKIRIRSLLPSVFE
ncbi:serine hydrolase domain-containing protein [Actinoplanes lutulentus]|uniref:serine hydrolase domain-containing protein n=1 Tax=Actinoplanes lutulentus TaxID=1287878 RepID=UPI0015EBE26D|nr:serine hydrolase domain-containing protein [Actinoplanes lutulentus]